MKFKLAIAAMGLCTPLLALSQPALSQSTHSRNGEAIATAQEKEAAIEQKVPVWLAQFDVPSAGIAYIEDGQIAFVRHFGLQQWGYPANEETLYNVASLTKPVTAEVVLRLITEGKTSLDAALADYHVEQDVADDPRIAALTPRLVMRHRTGFANWRYETGGVLQFSRDPNTETGYSGEGYEWMLKAVQAQSEENFETAARRLVFDPIGMKFTSYTRSKYFPYRTAMPYRAGEAVYDMIRSEPSASDDLRTTSREYASFILDVWDGDAVTSKLRKQQRTVLRYFTDKPACKGAQKAGFCPANEGWGLGWYILEWGDRTIVAHSGGDHGEKAFAFYDPGAKRGAVILTNGANGHEILNRLAGLLDGDKRFDEYMRSPY